jgi:hypothetical protein
MGDVLLIRLPIGAGSPDIIQAKMLDLMADLEFALTYLDDLFCIMRSILEAHLKK